ncbi:MAG: Ppx/GppA family phosphatase [Candidatus Rokubacteria bacterium]|nr:Ppx/GppA family phosphatase [Candidatus Rokubacteria bacterium]
MEVPPRGPRRALDQTQVITRLGEGLAVTRRLGEAAMSRTLAVVDEFCRRAHAQGADDILIVATSAVREALNRQEFVDRVQRAVGRAVEVVTGEEEARLALLGVLDGLPDLPSAFVLFDIGGGSTEFIRGRERRVVAAVSLPLGVVGLAERYMTAGPVDWSCYAAMEREIRVALSAGLSGFATASQPEPLVGTAGTVTTLAALDQELQAYDPERVQGYVLERPRIERLLRSSSPGPRSAWPPWSASARRPSASATSAFAKAS